MFEPRTVTPEVAGSSPVSHCEPNRVNTRTFLALARLRLRHREPLEVGARQKNGDQSLALERVHALLLRPCRRVQPCVAAFEELAAGTAYTPFPAGSLTAVRRSLPAARHPAGEHAGLTPGIVSRRPASRYRRSISVPRARRGRGSPARPRVDSKQKGGTPRDAGFQALEQRCAYRRFADLKSREIKPAELPRTISAFANADGGELRRARVQLILLLSVASSGRGVGGCQTGRRSWWRVVGWASGGVWWRFLRLGGWLVDGARLVLW